MATRILPAVGDADAARSVTALLSQLPDTDPAQPVGNSTLLLDTLAQLAHESVADLPEVVLVHERIGPLPALELVREVALRFPAAGVILITADTTPALFSAAMDAGARGVVGLPLSYDELQARVRATGNWAVGVRKHLAADIDVPSGPGGTVVTVTGSKGGVGTSVISTQLALAARASGRHVALVDLDLQGGDIASYLDVQFRRSVADLADIHDISPRVLQDVVFNHETGLGLLLAPGEGERAEEVSDRTARQLVSALRSRYQVVVIDCGTQLTGANAAAVEMADIAALVLTPDVVSVRAAKRMVGMWERLQVRKAEETLAVVNRAVRNTEIQPPLVERIVGTRVARSAIPAHFKDLQPAVDAGRLQDLDSRSVVKQAMWALAGELGLVRSAGQHAAGKGRRPRYRGDRGSAGFLRRRGDGEEIRPDGGPDGAAGAGL
ncbi:AAA family ATPase [Streptomyces roseoverticillatus]|uniref:AAA family ATPase n=1 Tax=Streptomyces roseoverticillatus TaxID=66429 RepID=UPI001F47FC7B|nr:P-loop NTPase [Streptomyces roseoverticillatus]MCF3105636.1 AAA family ATPase [Streptomyces roseoverticillatus]